MKIIDDISKEKVLVEMIDTHKYRTEAFYFNFKRGTVLNPYDRTIANVGYIGECDYRCDFNGSHFRKMMHHVWDNMIRRCYDETIRYKNPTYQNCITCDEWHNYQNFATWYEKNYYEAGNGYMHIDKDILYKNNNVYSPKTCLIVPQRINMMFMTKSRKTDSDLPQCISRKVNDRYGAMYGGKSLGVYNTLEEAMNKYNEAKYKAICEVADEYKENLPPKVYNALINWIPDNTRIDKSKRITV